MVSTKWAMGAILGAALAAAVPANAATTFADFQPVGNANNIGFKNAGSPGHSNGGATGTFYSLGSNGLPGAATVSFSFLLPGMSGTNITADFLLNATATAPASDDGTSISQQNVTGSFSFTSQSSFTIAGHTYAAGTNLLTATFANAEIVGDTGATSGTFDNQFQYDPTLTFTSSVLDFSAVTDTDFSFSLVSIVRSLSVRTPDATALRSFNAQATGNFDSAPLPVPFFAVPESATWAMFICGFGLMGATLRRRRVDLSLI